MEKRGTFIGGPSSEQRNRGWEAPLTPHPTGVSGGMEGTAENEMVRGDRFSGKKTRPHLESHQVRGVTKRVTSLSRKNHCSIFFPVKSEANGENYDT